jgi:tetratricopeptide (TPR) repeat protein
MSRITTFARKMMRINEKVLRSNTPTAIFGSIGDLPQSISSRANYRIGLWPCMSREKPEFAMGLWTALAHLLERWRDVQVYRLFVKLEGDPDAFEWSMEKSQFTVDEWDVEPLDENIGLWGKLEQDGDSWKLTATIDSDLLTGEDNEPEELHILAATVTDLIAMLPDFATQIAEKIGAERLDDADAPYPNQLYEENSALIHLMQQVLDWDVKLVSYLWDVEWNDDEIEASFQALIEAGRAVQNDFAAWLVSKAIAHTMKPGYSLVGDLLVEHDADVISAFPNSRYPTPIIAGSIYNMGFISKSHQLLEDEVKAHPGSQQSWLKLAELYANGGHLADSLRSFQSAIENNAVNSHLFRAYGNVLVASDQYNVELEDFTLIAPDEIEEDELMWEAIEAYEKALELDPNDIPALYSQLLQLAYTDDEDRLWAGFNKLLALDTSGEYVRDVIDSFYDIEDISPAISALQILINEQPERIDLYINLASLHLVHEDAVAARPLLEQAQTMTSDLSVLADIERLILAADDPEFEQRFAEMIAILDAGNELSADDVEYLEAIVEQMPNLIDAQLALARAYYLWDDTDEALEVLLDVQERVPDQANVLDLLSRILWESDQKVLAFQYLNRGLQAYPFNVALLARTGLYLFDNGQLQDARGYLARAEEIEPRNTNLQTVRAYIARKMAENPELYLDEDDDED